MPAFGDAVLLAVDAGLAAAAVLDADKVLAIAGVLEDEEARAVAAHATQSQRTTDLLRRMIDGEMIRAQLGDRDAEIGIAGGCVLLVVVFPRGKSATLLGVVFAYLYLVSGTILVPIVVHVLVDLRSLVLLPLVLGKVWTKP